MNKNRFNSPLEGIDGPVLALVAGVVESHVNRAKYKRSAVDPVEMAKDAYVAHQQYIDCCLQRAIDLSVDDNKDYL